MIMIAIKLMNRQCYQSFELMTLSFDVVVCVVEMRTQFHELFWIWNIADNFYDNQYLVFRAKTNDVGEFPRPRPTRENNLFLGDHWLRLSLNKNELVRRKTRWSRAREFSAWTLLISSKLMIWIVTALKGTGSSIQVWAGFFDIFEVFRNFHYAMS